ncbi:D-tyrosyl-tRNA(Tyr) deacylase [Dimargaris cristalligena]|uniref:D-aminoacyl-tRNA deacylase n=1 Tax=Dimargaris cristalligena TaxID=215637 RepID=A0A4P9ZLR7_9FUNG|nr:D-tyrosyl-tRNA(Tyr) deacylase [Dimargaris cristalligena]RKP33441.1 D-tyrosyl-tRNA deacylase [Dimargaris cristalligena]|eukprot:RKP33441.1 D-tyrosyl-tRNA deacylase [Dimargaris cristalligena]
MRAVIQRVTRASVMVDGSIVGSIGKGLCLLVGITNGDEPKDIEYLVRKILNLRLFDDEDGKMWKKGVQDLDLEILSVSQFTLYAKTEKGLKPDFHLAMKSSLSKDFYERFLQKLKDDYRADRIQDGQFGAMMDVAIHNDGPVTIILDSRQK